VCSSDLKTYAAGPVTTAGAAYVFERDSLGVWSEIAKLTADDAQIDDRFGIAVSLSGDRIMVGASNEDGGPGEPLVDAGAVYVFLRDGEGVWSQEARLTAIDAQAGDLFGHSVAIGDAGRAIVGARNEDGGPGDPLPDTGAAYAFESDGGPWTALYKLVAPEAQSGDQLGNVAISGLTTMAGALNEDGGEGDPLPDAGAVYVHDGTLSGVEEGNPAGTIDPTGRFMAHSPLPNPFSPRTSIRYELPADGAVRLRVFDVSGRHVRTLVDRPLQRAGTHTVTWDGTNTERQSVASGVYFYRLESGSHHAIRRMVLLK
ncbi:MAG: T9SS type A sorting domain-containing protein, partial [Myxococcales bacterium]|nr:T9SS type A sorting domain-containing protein [Myxococcales bacterium]